MNIRVLDADIEKLTKLKPAFKEGGTVTAGNSAGINDGGLCTSFNEVRKSKGTKFKTKS